MKLIKWDSLLPVDELLDEEPLSQAMAGWDLAVDVLEEDNQVNIEMQLPGVQSDKYDIKIEDGALVVSGEREETSETADHEIYRREIQRGSFERRVQLPEGEYNAEGISTGLENGVLKISVPKA